MGCAHKRHLLAVLLSRSRLLGPPLPTTSATGHRIEPDATANEQAQKNRER
jgi:hypothetical protein